MLKSLSAKSIKTLFLHWLVVGDGGRLYKPEQYKFGCKQTNQSNLRSVSNTVLSKTQEINFQVFFIRSGCSARHRARSCLLAHFWFKRRNLDDFAGVPSEPAGWSRTDRGKTQDPVDFHVLHDFSDRLRETVRSEEGTQRQIQGEVPSHSAHAQQIKKVKQSLKSNYKVIFPWLIFTKKKLQDKKNECVHLK